MTPMEKYLKEIRGWSFPGVPAAGVRLFKVLQAMQTQQKNIAQQTNSNPEGEPGPPPPLASLTVTPTAAGVHLSVAHPGEFYRGIEYHAEYADNPAMSNPFPAYMGPAREHDVAVGTKKLYWRAFAQYPTGARTDPVYHGGAQPAAVAGGSETPLGISQGSGTGQPGEGLSGHGSIAFRTATGAPPVRGTA